MVGTNPSRLANYPAGLIKTTEKTMRHTVGERVGVILGTQGKVVEIFGYGVYDGDLPGGPLGSLPNPRITLDDGEVVWGCEVWWGTEQKIKNHLSAYEKAGYTIKTVNRANYRRTQ